MNDVNTAAAAPRFSMRDRMAMYTDNALKIGLFGSNCSSGRAVTLVPERWTGNWEDNLALAKMSDAAGIEFMLPVGRWKGYGGDTDYMGTSLETITWATGLLGHTKRLIVFGTVHAPLFHPLIAAKQFVTADHVSEGRFGLNIVVGWNEDEFQMFGVTKKEHDVRYEQGEEWWSIVKRLWAGETPFAFEGAHYRLLSVEGSPTPYGDRGPLMMNAGSSEAGRGFAIRHSDMHFDAVETPEASAGRIAETKRLARAHGHDIQVWTPVGVICRPTQKEADEYVQYVVDHADWGAIGYLAEMHAKDGRPRTDPQHLIHSGRNPAERRALARGSYCVIGDPDAVAREFSRLRSAGLDGLAITSSTTCKSCRTSRGRSSLGWCGWGYAWTELGLFS